MIWQGTQILLILRLGWGRGVHILPILRGRGDFTIGEYTDSAYSWRGQPDNPLAPKQCFLNSPLSLKYLVYSHRDWNNSECHNLSLKVITLIITIDLYFIFILACLIICKIMSNISTCIDKRFYNDICRVMWMYLEQTVYISVHWWLSLKHFSYADSNCSQMAKLSNLTLIDNY